MRRVFPLILFFFFISPSLWAQPSIQAQIDRETITLSDTLRLTIVIRGGSALTTPEIPAKGNFEVVGRSSGNVIEIINGEMSVTNTFEYMLRPVQAGKFSIGPITTHIDGRTFSAGPVQVTVLETGGPGYKPLPEPTPYPPGPPPTITPGYPQDPQDVFPSAAPPQEPQRPDTFVTAQVDKQSAYVGEQILYTFRLYSAVSLDNASLKMPEFKEFISEELIKENKYETVLEGRRYAVNEVRVALFPTKAGKVSTGKANVEALVPYSFRYNPQDPFSDPFFQGRSLARNGERKSFSTDNIEIEVKELPTRPNNFSGLVGEFSVESHLDQDRLAAGETLHYDITLQGRGNIREAQFPKIPDSPFFKVYPGTPKVEEEKNLQGIGGKKTFNYALVANRPGTTQLGPFVTTFFNPKTGAYEELTVPAQPIQITGEASQESLVSAGIDRRDGSLLDSKSSLTGLQGIAGLGAVLTRSIPASGLTVLWWMLLLVPPAGYLILLLIRRAKRRREALSEDRKRSQAFRKAKQALGQVSWDGDPEAFIRVSTILREYLSDAFLIKGGAMTPREVEDLLVSKQIPADTTRRMVYFLEELDSWKYGGTGQGVPQGLEMKNEMVDLLREIEKAL